MNQTMDRERSTDPLLHTDTKSIQVLSGHQMCSARRASSTPSCVQSALLRMQDMSGIMRSPYQYKAPSKPENTHTLPESQLQKKTRKEHKFTHFCFFPYAGLYFRKAPDTLKCLRHVMRAILFVRPKCSHRCVSLKESPYINRANVYENEMV